MDFRELSAAAEWWGRIMIIAWLIAVPLAAWKVVEIVYWVIHNVTISVN